jgi:hypothetical protein
LNLLERTRRLFQGLTPPARPRAGYFDVACPEGHRLSGERTEGYQALRCPSCGEGMFVLPRSPLPEPVAPEATGRPKKIARSIEAAGDLEPIALTDPFPDQGYEGDIGPAVDVDDAWLEIPRDVEPAKAKPAKPARPDDAPANRQPQPTAEPAPKKKPRPTAEGAAARAPRAAATPVARPARPRDVEPAEFEARPGLGAWLGERRNPLFFLTVLTIVVATVAFKIHRSRLEALPRVIEAGRTEGLAALDAGRFETAHKLLSEAARALDTLGDDSREADEIRQGAREATIYTGLTPEPLENILGEATPDSVEWTARFDAAYKGRTILVDAHVSAVPDATGAGRYELDYLVLPPGEGSKPLRIGRLDLTGFTLLQQPPRQVGDRVVFGARLASFTMEHEGVWQIGLEPESGVYILHPKALDAVARPSGADLAVENRQ